MIRSSLLFAAGLALAGSACADFHKAAPRQGGNVFDLIVQALEQSASKELDEAVVLSQLALTFPRERPQRVLRTVVAWARYAALFQYNSTRRVFHGLQPSAAAT